MMIDKKALLERLLDYVQIDSETGDEAAMAQRLIADFKAIGCEVSTDDRGLSPVFSQVDPQRRMLNWQRHGPLRIEKPSQRIYFPVLP